MAERSIPASGFVDGIEQGYFLFIDPANGTSYDNVVCLLTFDFSYATSVNNATTMCGPSSSAGDVTATINLNGETLLDPDTGKISAPDLFTLIKNNTTFAWLIGKLTPLAGDITKSGHGFFSNYTENYSATAKGAFSATISIDGAVDQVTETGS
ncbi:MAG: hypothetical protein ABJA79_06485 [Parafilimonas sp.]